MNLYNQLLSILWRLGRLCSVVPSDETTRNSISVSTTSGIFRNHVIFVTFVLLSIAYLIYIFFVLKHFNKKG